MRARVCSLIKMQEPELNTGLLSASGVTVPSAVEGYQTGCIFQKTDGGDGTALYVNEGSVTSCDFNAIEGGGDPFADGITITGATGYAIDIATSGVFRMGVQDTGVDVTTAYPFAMDVQCEANADVVPGATGSSAGIYSRYAIEAAQTTQCSHISMFGKLRVKANLADGVHAAGFFYVEQSGTNTTSGSATTLTAAVHAAIETAATYTLSTGHLNGICVDSSINAGATINGTLAAIRIKKGSGKLAWTTGITLEAAACTNGISLSVTTQACSMTVTALPANARGSRFAYTCATPAMDDGYGAHEIDLTVTGTATAKTAAASTWVNVAGTATLVNYNHVHSDGIWDGGATLTGAYISWAKYQCMLQSNPAWCSLWELNFDGANSEVDSLFNVNSLILSLGYQAGTPTKAAVGSIPFCSEAGGQLRYIYLYDAPDSD